ncbi:MAG: hypothetical protein SF162_16005 [bacterium]|nr:hypothetical protein [bacterium]
MADIEMPDFDNMTPEEIQLWMESLAKKQGATEGLITAADMEIADIDPNSVVIDEPGYVPSETFKSRATKEQPKVEVAPPAPAAKPEPKAEPAPPPPAPVQPARPAVAVTPPPPQAPAPPPVTSTPPRGSGERVRLPNERPEPARQEPIRPAAQVPPPPPPTPPTPAPAAPSLGGEMAWLESLAAGLPDDGFGLDLSALSDEAIGGGFTAAAEAAPAREPADTDAWLQSLVSAGGELDGDPILAEPPTRTAQPTAAYQEPTDWLDALSQSAELDIEAPVPARSSAPAQPALTDPTDWLSALSESGELGDQSLAAAPAGIEVDSATMNDIERAIREGRVSPEQMQLWLDRQTDILVQQPEISLDDFYDPDAPPVPADLPDWLLESVSPPQTPESPVAQNTPALLDSLFDAPAAESATSDVDMPDWLKPVPDAEEQAVDFGSIFAETTEEAGDQSEPLEALDTAFELDPNDNWAEAFDLEQESGANDLTAEPEWYRRNTSDPARIAAIDALAANASGALEEAALPMDEALPVGQRTAAPDWLSDEADAEPVGAGDVLMDDDVPDWLRETADAAIDPDMPAWLIETEQASFEQPAFEAPPPMPAPVTVITPPQAAPVPPLRPVTPQPVALPANVMEALNQARDFSRGDDLEGGLRLYEAMIRQNAALDDVVGDLEGLVRIHRTNPAVYRVLGDGLMRQGKLQQALDTYRDALNQL